MDADLESYYLRRLGNSDHQAFDMLFMRYHPQVKSFLRGFIKDEELVLDMAQDIFVKVWANRKEISSIHSFKGYLFRMARNLVYDNYEHWTIVEKYGLEQKAISESFYSDIIEENLYAKELSLLIDITVDKMPPQRKKIFVMSRKKGFSNEEIAAHLQINKRTVENHLTQALRDLRKVIYFLITFFLFFSGIDRVYILF